MKSSVDFPSNRWRLSGILVAGRGALILVCLFLSGIGFEVPGNPVVIEDPELRVEGDSRRQFLEIEQATAEANPGGYVFVFMLAEAPPSGTAMLGLGMDYVLHLLSVEHVGEADSLEVFARYTSEGWCLLRRDEEGDEVPFPGTLQIIGASVRVYLESAIVEPYHYWTVSSTTACAPRWRPISFHPQLAPARLPKWVALETDETGETDE